jgi:hypothetical protein
VFEDGEGGRLRYWPTFLHAAEASQLYDHLLATTTWSQGGQEATTSSPLQPPSYVNKYGTRVSTPRLQRVRIHPLLSSLQL